MPDTYLPQTTSPDITICQYATYYRAIRGSVGSRIFCHLIALKGGAVSDLVEGGDIACAYFASWILLHFHLIQEPHATVAGLLRDAKTSGWVSRDVGCRIQGALLEWGQMPRPDGSVHGHVGFCTGPYTAISHCSSTHYPDEHAITGARGLGPLVAVYTHPFLFGQ